MNEYLYKISRGAQLIRKWMKYIKVKGLSSRHLKDRFDAKDEYMIARIKLNPVCRKLSAY
jgi:hypothetical protein